MLMLMMMVTNLNSGPRQILFDGQAEVMFNRGGQIHAWIPGGRTDLVCVILGGCLRALNNILKDNNNLVLKRLDSFSFKTKVCLRPFRVNSKQQGPGW